MERSESNIEEENGSEEDVDDEAEDGQEERSEKKQSKIKNRTPMTPTQSVRSILCPYWETICFMKDAKHIEIIKLNLSAV